MSDDKWKAIEVDLSLYKFYLELLLKGATVALALTGGIVSYCLANVDGSKPIKFSLILPLVVNAGFAAICWKGRSPARKLWVDHKKTCKDNGFGEGEEYDFSPLVFLVELFAAVYAVIAAGLAGLLLYLLNNAGTT
ncbi:MAG TPA: hypothetical protein VHO06_08530 [Polyangia bacterium]|nr:hypothetical protein [Polyangia bacterium]